MTKVIYYHLLEVAKYTYIPDWLAIDASLFVACNCQIVMPMPGIYWQLLISEIFRTNMTSKFDVCLCSYYIYTFPCYLIKVHLQTAKRSCNQFAGVIRDAGPKQIQISFWVWYTDALYVALNKNKKKPEMHFNYVLDIELELSHHFIQLQLPQNQITQKWLW